MSALITTNDLTLTYGTKQVLHGISITIPDNNITAIIGPNGSGKTSLLNCLSGLNSNYHGDISIGHQSLDELDALQLSRQLGYLHQHMPANLYLTVRQVVELGLIPRLKPWSMISKDHLKLVSSAINKVKLNGFEDRPFDTLSGGEKQRVLIAKVIVQAPDILLLDEPTNHLDIKYQIEVMSLIRSLDMSVICCIHDLNLAASYADHIICLNDGKVAFEGPRNEVLTAEHISRVYDVECKVTEGTTQGMKHIQFQMGGR